MRLDPSKKYIHQFNDLTEYSEYAFSSAYTEPFVATCVPMEEAHDDKLIKYNKSEKDKLRENPLTFEITGDGNIVWKAQNTAYTCTIEYKKNDGAWTSITSSTGGTNISVVSGDTVQFRGNNTTYCSGSSRYNYFSGTTCNFKLSGNIMSLINPTGFASTTTLESAYTFNRLFMNCTGLTDASNLVLPATTLAEGCYRSMFTSCMGLTRTPELPATTLADNCYRAMFQSCAFITTAQNLPATTLANSCYNAMFAYCSSLTTAPTLPATTLASNCYNSMFYGCNFLTTAPELPATTLADRCYNSMFNGCSSLNYIKCLATDISASNCTTNWVDGVQTNSGTFVKNPNMSSWTTGVNGIPANWTTQNAT